MEKLGKYKQDFPFFEAHPDAIYLDSSATTQKPRCVIDALSAFYRADNVNAGRGTYALSTELARQIEDVRSQVQHFIRAAHPSDIMFTNGATDAQEKIAQSLLTYLQDGDEILFSPSDHRSFILPWMQLQNRLKKFGLHISLIPYKIKLTGDADIDDILSKVTSRTKLINITHIHNVFGSDSDIHRLKGIRKQGVIINVDATQSVGHTQVDVEQLGADILSFSGHKMFASLGTGVLYMRHALQEQIGEYAPKELGTKDYAGIRTLGAAITYIENIGVETIHNHLTKLTQYTIQALKQVHGIQFTKGLAYCPCVDGYGIVSCNIDGYDPLDIAFYLAKRHIMIRAGSHCTIETEADIHALRVSMHIYNTTEDIDMLVMQLQNMINALEA